MPPRCARWALRSSRRQRFGCGDDFGEAMSPDIFHLLPAVHDAAEELRRALGVVHRGMRLAAVPALSRGLHGAAQYRLPVGEATERHRVEAAERVERPFLV